MNCNNFYKMFNYGSIDGNIINYSNLFTSLYYSSEVKNDYRIFVVIVVATLFQILLCSCLIPCYGISIIYTFIFGFLIKKYRRENNIKKSNNLLILYYLLITASFISVLYNKNSTVYTDRFNNTKDIYINKINSINKNHEYDNNINELQNMKIPDNLHLFISFYSIHSVLLGIGCLFDYIPIDTKKKLKL